MADDYDLGEAADYICGERPRLEPAHVWAVLNEVGSPPPAGSDGIAEMLLASTHPEVPTAVLRTVLAEWRAYAELVDADD